MAGFLKRLQYYSLILLDRETPWYIKLILAAGLLYIIYPVDLLTDTIPFLGWLDDLTIGSLLVALSVRLVPKHVINRVNNKIYGPGKK
jgi:uncharacterized membrane protein YkvA (DUF1232 family)